eukprot:2848182-Pleurochrysis_carterae.AAC.1
MAYLKCRTRHAAVKFAGACGWKGARGCVKNGAQFEACSGILLTLQQADIRRREYTHAVPSPI